MAPWLTDWRGKYHGRAAAMLSPATTEEVAAVVRLCGDARAALVPQGGNSGMVGGATPLKELQPRLKCRKCGEKGGSYITIAKLPR